jgi:hypothetical protein
MKSNFPSNDKLRYYVYLVWNSGVPSFVIKVETHIARSFIEKLGAISILALQKITGYDFHEKYLSRKPELEKSFGWHKGIVWSGQNSLMHEFTIRISRHDPDWTLANLSLMFSILNAIEIDSEAEYLQPIWFRLKLDRPYTLSGCMLTHVRNTFLEAHKRSSNSHIKNIRSFGEWLCESHSEPLRRLKISYEPFEVGGFGHHSAFVLMEETDGDGLCGSKNIDTYEQLLILLACLTEMTQFEFLPQFEATY